MKSATTLLMNVDVAHANGVASGPADSAVSETMSRRPIRRGRATRRMRPLVGGDEFSSVAQGLALMGV